MSPFRWRPGSGVIAAMLASAAVGAQFVSSRAARDALFLGHFDPTSLPMMMMTSSVVSIGLIVISWSALRHTAPSKHVPATFAASAVLITAEWASSGVVPGVAACVVYVQVTALGPLLGSGFWLIASEALDPHTAKKHYGEIAGAGTLGCLAGGLIGARVAATWGATAMLPLLAILQTLCAWQMHVFARSMPATLPSRVSEKPVAFPSALRVLADAPYLRSLAALVLVGNMAAVFIDYVFKAQAKATFATGAALGRFFSLYDAAVNVVTFVMQTAVSRIVIEHLGLAAAVGAPSLVLAITSMVSIIVPGFRSVLVAHASERATRGSLLRTGYEIFYTPLAPGDKRAVKATIDVGIARAGDVMGAAGVQILLVAMSGPTTVLLLACGVGCSLLALVFATPLTRGYVKTLEQRLLNRAVEVDLPEVSDRTTRTVVLRTIARSRNPALALTTADSDVGEISALHSRDDDAIRRVLRDPNGIPASLVPHVIPLLASDAVADDAVHALRGVAEEHVGELVDALVDPNQPFAVRRRLPRAFSVCVSQRAADGLMLGLDDMRFEVRFQCARSLAAVVDKNARVRVDAEYILSTIRREVAVSRSVWEGRQLLDGIGGGDEPRSLPERLIAERASQSLAHVFTLLSLILPTEPLRIAFCALHTSDPGLRGTALEYLDSVLPADIRERLWPFLEEQPAARRRARARDVVVADLLRSNASIVEMLTGGAPTGADPGPPASTRRSSV